MATEIVIDPLPTTTASDVKWSLLELQGTLLPPGGEVGDTLVGDVEVAPAVGKRVPCYLRIGTLSIEGDVAKLPKAFALLEQVSQPETSATAVRPGAVTMDAEATMLIVESLRYEPFVFVGDDGAVEAASKKRPRDYGMPEAETDDGGDTRYVCRGFLTERFFIKSKPVRSIPPRA
jgi:hypothetical protein